ncbi:MAG: hypothetical protein WKG52_08230 [Variovorax sp.]
MNFPLRQRKRQGRSKWLVLAILLPVLSGCDAQTADTGSFAPYSLAPPPEAVIGDLGGVPVSIPREYARLVEYEGDPHWLEKPKGAKPVRTFESKLTSFGILAHYPDMKPLSKETQESYRTTRFRDSEWISMGVVAGSNLRFGNDPLDRPYESRVPGHEPHPFFTYEQLPMVHGMTPYQAVKDIGPNLILDDENRSHSAYNHILYFARENDKIVAFIKCGSGLAAAPGGTKTCEHHFVFWPEMKAQAELRYAPDFLPNWRSYQASYRALLLGFRVDLGANPQPVPSLKRSTRCQQLFRQSSLRVFARL